MSMIWIFIVALSLDRALKLNSLKVDNVFGDRNLNKTVSDHDNIETTTYRGSGNNVVKYPKKRFEKKLQDRIIKGRFADYGEYPFIVGVSSKSFKPHCGGSILNTLYIMTACHCLVVVDTTNPMRPTLTKSTFQNFRVIAGSVSNIPGEQQGFQLRWIFESFIHPKCFMMPISLEWVYDAGIIEVTEPFIFNHFVRPVELPSDAAKYTEAVETFMVKQAECLVGGWGADKTKIHRSADNKTVEIIVSHSEHLKILDSRLLPKLVCFKYRLCRHKRDKNKCSKEMGEMDTPRMCAWARTQGEGTACYGDSGGPLICGGIVVGLVSYGDFCFDMHIPVVFTRIDKVFSFVTQYYHSSSMGKSDVWRLSTIITILSSFQISWRLFNK